MKVRPRIGCDQYVDATDLPVYTCRGCKEEVPAPDMNHRKTRGHIIVSPWCVQCYRRGVRIRTVEMKIRRGEIAGDEITKKLLIANM
jgi:hypothetical protein